ncbi:trans-sialidase, putative [Trypanosoma cruzi marinkellei]|uniref:Trans-sialidase, putative n=1 Tax=Trypanosoma cruzi marinkellei TaxID=85056 RepID=K2NJV7_TRYCR|nr:trans-sialidase, putative [Trypanosoma cruzi marinkellei]
MHSRVAAVTAPRTHNRRRVTGSSGRRREGRESERQRPNMSRHHFYSPVLLFLLVVMCCGTGGAADTGEHSTEPSIKWKDVNCEDGVTVESLGAPGLLKVENDVFAVAEAQCKKGGDTNIFTGIASQLLTEGTADKPEEILKEGKGYTQILEKGGSAEAQIRLDVSRPTTVVEGNDIYMLVGKCNLPAEGGAQERDACDRGLLIVKGSITGDENGDKKRIQWSDTNGLPRISVDEQREYLTGLVGGGGSGVHTNDGKLLFPVEGTKKKEGQKKAVSLLIYSLSSMSWTLSNWMSADGCSNPSVVEWEKDNQLMMMTACDDGRRRVYESGDKGKSWTEALGTLSRVSGQRTGWKWC